MQVPYLLVLTAIAAHSCFAATLKELLASDPDLAGYNDLFKYNTAALDELAARKGVTLFLSNTESFKRNAPLVDAAKKNPSQISELIDAISANGTFPTSSFAGKGKIIRTNLVGPPAITNMTDGSPIKAQNDVITSGEYVKAKITRGNIKYNNGLIHILDEFIFAPVSIPLTTILIKNVGLAVAELFVSAVGRPPPPKKETFIAYTAKAYLEYSYLALYKPADFLASLNAYELINTTIVYGPEIPEKGISVPTVLGPALNFTTNAKGKLFVNGIPTVKQDILVSNGVFHVVDQLLAPPGFDLSVPNYNFTPPIYP